MGPHATCHVMAMCGCVEQISCSYVVYDMCKERCHVTASLSLRTNRNEEGHSDSVAEMLMSQLFGKSVSTSAPSPQSFPDSTCQTEFTDIVGGDLNDGRQAGQQAKTPKHCQKKCQGRGPDSRTFETQSLFFSSFFVMRLLED
jgi:hypothetical protein